MRRINSVFVYYVGNSKGNMFRGNNKGRRKQKLIQTKNVNLGKSIVSPTKCDINSSPMRKEAKLDDSKNEKNNDTDDVHLVSDTQNLSVHTSSFSYTKVTGVSNINDSKSNASMVPSIVDFYQKKPNVLQNHTDVSHFSMDETPVAVPIHSPSTPHRINMPDIHLQDLDNQNLKDKSKMLVITSVLKSEQPLKKSANRGRRKLNNNQSATNRSASSPNVTSTNHKLTDFFPVRRSVRKCKKTVLEEKQRDMENKVLSQVEEGLEVRHFAGKGRGVITTREFMKGEFVVEYIGELIDQVKAKEREKIYAQDQNTGCYMYYFQHRNHQYCVDATAETDKLGRLVNHSRNGNLIARVIEVESTPHLVLTAKENIPVGVEVTYDYGDRSREAIRHHPWLAL